MLLSRCLKWAMLLVMMSMLSIATVTRRQSEFYYDKEDYYNRTATHDDKWQGKMPNDLGIKNDQAIKAEDFHKALASMPSPERAALDATFSAPKSVSIAMALDDDKKADMIDCQNRAVTETLAEIEKEIKTRVTQNGITERVTTGNMLTAKFNHFISRNQDMQLHTHCVILNRTVYEGKSYAITNDNLYQNKVLYGQLYRNRLAKNLQEMGYKCNLTDAEKGFFELDGLDVEIIEKFSTRRAEILEQLKKWNADDAATASKATLLTRKAKVNKDLSALQESWREQLKEHEITIDKQEVAIDMPKENKDIAFDKAVERLSANQFAFTERELERATLAEGCTAGMDRADFQKILESNLVDTSENTLVQLGISKDDDGSIYYSTKQNIATEQKIIDNVLTTRNRVTGINTDKVRHDLKTIDNLLPADKKLSLEQKKAIMHISTTKDQYTAIEGLAGTGKTYMLSTSRHLIEQNGYTIRGMAYTGKAAEGLSTEAGIKSTTIHSLLNKLEKEAGNAIPDEDLTQKKTWNFEGLKPPTNGREVWVVDEAGLIDNNIMLQLQTAAQLKQAKVILVGDSRQLQPVGVGNAYTNLVRSNKIATVTLSDIRRQKNETLLNAVKEAVNGDINKSLGLLDGSTQEIKSTPKRLTAITKEYTSLTPAEQDNTVILTARNKDRIEINNQIREQLIKDRKLEEGQNFKIQTGKLELNHKFAPGDRIIFLQNHHKLGVMNGQAAKVVGIENDTFTVQCGQKTFSFNAKEYNHFDHGYALTTYKSQGITQDWVLINFDSTQRAMNTRNAFYVDISRARHKVKIFTDSKEKMSKQVTDFAKKVTSDDFLIKSANENHKPTLKIPKINKLSQVNLKTLKIPTLSLPLPGPLKILNVPIKTAQFAITAGIKTVTTAAKTIKAGAEMTKLTTSALKAETTKQNHKLTRKM